MAGAGIGEVSAVATFLQIGFSLATTLTTYIADVKDAPDGIAGLASETDSTLRHVEELDLLLLENEKKQGWNENGIVYAKKCRSDAERIVRKIVKLLKKSGTDISATRTVERQDIDISLFRRGGWLRFKSRVEVVKNELERTKIDILLVRDLYKAKSGFSQDDEALAKSRLVSLIKRKQRAKEQLQRAREVEEQRLSATDTQAQPYRQGSIATEDSKYRESSPGGALRARSLSYPSGIVRSGCRNSPHPQGRTNANNDFSPTSSGSDTDISLVDYGEITELVREDLHRQTAGLSEHHRLLRAVSEEAVDTYRSLVVQEIIVFRSKLEESTSQAEGAFGLRFETDLVRGYIPEQYQKEIGQEMKKIYHALPLSLERSQQSAHAEGSKRIHSLTDNQEPSRRRYYSLAQP